MFNLQNWQQVQRDHSLNLVASCDASEAREDKSYQRSYDRAMAKPFG